MPTVLFVCTANQFRSPLAAACFARKLRDMQTAGDWHVLSAGTWTPPGERAHPRAVRAAAALGLDLSAHRTREVDAPTLAAADLIVVMTRNHREALEIEFPDTRGKIRLLGELAGLPGGEIADPALNDFAQSQVIARLLCNSVDKAFEAMVQYASLREDRSVPPLTQPQ